MSGYCEQLLAHLLATMSTTDVHRAICWQLRKLRSLRRLRSFIRSASNSFLIVRLVGCRISFRGGETELL